jgi:hypothetical protein
MTPKNVLMLYITLPCLLYGVFLILGLTLYSDMVARDTLYAAHTVFSGYMALVVYTKRGQLTAE